LLKSGYLPSKIESLSIRNQILLFIDTDLIPLIIQRINSKTPQSKIWLNSIISDLTQKALIHSSLYAYALQSLLHKLTRQYSFSQPLLI
jgi:hypothetical protein